MTLLSQSLSFSQYPKQTVINGDTILMMTIGQAEEINRAFSAQNSAIDSLNYRVIAKDSTCEVRLYNLKQDSVQNLHIAAELDYMKNVDRRTPAITTVIISVIVAIMFPLSIFISQ